MTCLDAIIVILARPTMPCIHLVITHLYAYDHIWCAHPVMYSCTTSAASATIVFSNQDVSLGLWDPISYYTFKASRCQLLCLQTECYI